MAKRWILGICLFAANLIVVCLVSAWLTSWFLQPDVVHRAATYPDTGYPNVLPPMLDRVAPIPATPNAASFHQVNGYDNKIHPDEDLLHGLQAPEGVGSPPAAVESQPPPNVDSVPTEPQIIRPSPGTVELPAATPDPYPTTGAPSPLVERPSPDVQPVDEIGSPAPPTSPTQDYDPYAPPAADEDLLLPRPAAPNRPATPQPSPSENSADDTESAEQPIEVLPTRPVPDPSSERIPSSSGYPSTDATPPPAVPPAAPPASSQPSAPPFYPPSHAKPLVPDQASIAAGEVDPHAAVFADTMYPSAKKCRACHEQIYDEWAVSSHAYASVSPMFQKFEQTISQLTIGTIGYFCMRCHAPVATALNEPREGNIFGSIASAQEGVTCIACHRVREEYGKSNGERRIEPGMTPYDPVYGSGYGEGLAEVLSKKSHYKVRTQPEKGPGQDIHRQVIHFPQLADSSFCVSCHQVFVAPGIELEVVWEQYRASPACKQGITCQDCHMGAEPGVAAGYEHGPVAVVNEKPVSPHRRHSNHVFYGPGYSIAHPGIFPHNPDAEDWTADEWLMFDYRAGWGTDGFEDAVKDGFVQAAFPKVWENSDDRYDAREIIDANLAKLREKLETRRRLMENSSHVEGPIFARPARAGKPLRFHYLVTNSNSGHNMPSGSLGAQPQLWLNIALTGPDGQHVWETGYVDANGDIADLHSLEVAAGRIPRDQQLVNYQTKFLITGVKGTDREMYLPINVDFDQLPFIRPSGFPVTVMNHPPFIRMEAHSIPPLATRKECFNVPARLMKQPGKYRLSVRMRSRAEPIYFMRFCNATPEMERTMNEWMLDFHEHATEFWVR